MLRTTLSLTLTGRSPAGFITSDKTVGGSLAMLSASAMRPTTSGAHSYLTAQAIQIAAAAAAAQAAATLGNGAAQLLFPAQAKPNHFPRLETDWTYKEPVEIVTDAFNPAPGWEQVCVHLPQPTWWDRLWHGKVLGRDLYSTLLARAWREGRGSDDKARLEAIRRRLGYLGPLTVLLGPGPDSGFRLDEDTKKFLAEYIALDAEHFRLSCGKVFKHASKAHITSMIDMAREVRYSLNTPSSPEVLFHSPDERGLDEMLEVLDVQDNKYFRTPGPGGVMGSIRKAFKAVGRWMSKAWNSIRRH